jgi:hypothetical protein
MKVEPIGWAIAEYRFRRPAVGPFPTEADARAYLAEHMDKSQGWHVIPLNAPDPNVIVIACHWRPFDPALDVGPMEVEEVP